MLFQSKQADPTFAFDCIDEISFYFFVEHFFSVSSDTCPLIACFSVLACLVDFYERECLFYLLITPKKNPMNNFFCSVEFNFFLVNLKIYLS